MPSGHYRGFEGGLQPQNQRVPLTNSWIKYFRNEKRIVNFELVFIEANQNMVHRLHAKQTGTGL